jgi:uncharacterized membrane protein (UPF0127 family)
MSKRLTAEIANDYLSLQYGLMDRKGLAKDSGMLFDFGSARPLSFWMKNTYIPLQIAFVDASGKIGQIESMVPLSTRAVRSNSSYRYAIEVKDGWFDENGISVGAQVELPPDVSPQQTPQTQNAPPVSPDIQIERSVKDILRAVNDFGVKIIIEYETKDGKDLPPKAIEPPMVFGDTADGDAGGLVTAFDSQDPKNPYKSFLVENIKSVKDLKGNPITTVQQVEQIARRKPLSKEDVRSIEGKDIGG